MELFNLRKKLLTTGLILLTTFTGFSQVTTIDFETAGAGYTPSGTEGTTFIDVFNRVNDDLPVCANESGFYWAIEDLNALTDPSIDLAQIDVTGSTSFTFSVDMVAHHYYDWDVADELLITYSIDGGAYQNLMSVQSVPDGDNFNAVAALDTDFDGNGECINALPSLTTGTDDGGCTVSTSDFQTFATGAIALAGNSTLDIRLQFNGFTSADEGMYLDNIVITESGGAATCNISSSGVANIACNNDGTIPDATDDYITFDLDPSGSTLGATYSVSASVGSITPNTGISYGSATTFTLDPGTAGGGTDIDVTITDVDDGTCTFVQTITDPGSCSSNDCGDEDFTNSNATGSYTDNSFVGNSGVTWTYTESRDGNGDANGSGINLPALMLRDATSTLTSDAVAGGIGDFSCKLYKGFTGGGDRQVELFVNGVSQGSSVIFDDFAEHTFTVTGINISGAVTVELRNIAGNQIIVDDITWTCYSCGAPSNATGLTATSSCGDVYVNWEAPTCVEEVLIVARENSTVAAGTPSGDGSAYTADADFTGAGSALLSGIVVYKGTDTTVTITNMTGTAHVKIFTRVGTTWSSGVSTSVAVDNSVSDATSFSSTSTCGGIGLGWVLPACYDEVLIVARDGSAVTATPSGDGTAYTDNLNFGSGTDLGSSQFAVYKGTGTGATITNLTGGNTYHFTIFTRKGTNWSAGTTTSVTMGAGSVSGPTTFNPGELIFVGYDSYIGTGEDKWSILTLVDIGPGTEFIIGNALYDWNAPAGVLSNKWYPCAASFTAYPEFMEFTYNGCSDIPAGSVICISTDVGGMITGDITVGGAVATSDFSWTGDAGNMSTSNPDAMWLMQGTLGADLTEPDGPDADGAVDHYTTFDGVVLGAVQTLGDFQDPALVGNAGGTRVSRYHPDVTCIYINAGLGGSRFYGYHNGLTSGTFYDLIANITDVTTNWVINNTDSGDDLATAGTCGSTYTLTGMAGRSGRWRGGVSTDWFDCSNWENFSVPRATQDVVINTVAVRDCDVSYTSPFAYLYGDVAECDTLFVAGRSLTVDELGDSINVYGMFTIRGTGSVDMNDDNAGTTKDGDMFLHGTWENRRGTAFFDEGNSTINFVGDGDQDFWPWATAEDLGNVVVEKPSGHVLMVDEDMQITDTLKLISGNIQTGVGRYVYTLNTEPLMLTNFSANSFVNGNLRRAFLSGQNYFFPVGYGNNTTDYHLASIMNTSLTGVSYIDGSVENLAEAGNNIDARIQPTLIQTGIGRVNNIHSEAIWTFNPDAAPSGGTYGVQLYEMNVAGLVDNMFVPVKRASSSTDYADWDIYEATTTIQANGNPGRVTNGGVGYAQRVGYTDFSHHAIADLTPALSLKSINLKADNKSSIDKVNLEWTPSVEGVDAGIFSLQRSYDGKEFETIDKQKLDLSKAEYTFIDKNNNSNKAYYRVIFNSENGDKVSSNVEVIDLLEKFDYSVYPNPNNGSFTLRLNSTEDQVVQYTLFDMLGKSVVNNSILVNGLVEQNLNLNNVQSGIYLLTVQTNSVKETIKIVVK